MANPKLYMLGSPQPRPPVAKATRAQREALKRVYLRVVNEAFGSMPVGQPGTATVLPEVPTYRQFRRTCVSEVCGQAILVPFAGMWLGIEPDGYCHS